MRTQEELRGVIPGVPLDLFDHDFCRGQGLPAPGIGALLASRLTAMIYPAPEGEVLDLRSDAPAKPFVLNREGWALPVGDGRWRTGTNWSWDDQGETPTTAIPVVKKLR